MYRSFSRIVCAIGVLTGLMSVVPQAFAECGGQQQCIGVSIDPSVMPAHGTPETSAPLAFGNQTITTSSAARTILVAGVLGPAGTRATLNSITLTGTDAAQFRISSSTCVTGTPSLLHDGNATASAANTCSLGVTFAPTSEGSKSASLLVSSSAITRTIPLTGTGTSLTVGAGAASLSASADTPAILDLKPFVTGSTVAGVRITTAPTHGSATVSGFTVTYVPATGYIGADSFSYVAFDASASSSSAVVTVSVVPRADPSLDPTVRGVIGAQTQSVTRFARAQTFNIQRRMESLHRSPRGSGGTGSAVSNPAPRDELALNGNNRIQVAAAAQPALEPSGADVGSGLLRGGLTQLASSLSTRTLSLSGFSGSTDGGSRSGGLGWWAGGSINFGHDDRDNPTDSLRFSTDGISVGADYRFSDRFVLGAGLGYARDDSQIGQFGSFNRAQAWSLSLYGSYQPTDNTFIDALIGYGDSRHDMQRYVAPGTFASAQRNGDQIFGSLAAGYEFRHNGLMLSPYGRFDFAHDTLDQAIETGAGLSSLAYMKQTFQTLALSLGLRAESVHRTSFGWAVPRARLEYRHDFDDDRDTTIAYADRITGPQYTFAPPGIGRDALTAGIGSDFVFRRGYRIGVDYMAQFSSGLDANHGVRMWVALDPGARPPQESAEVHEHRFGEPVRIEAGYTRDDNVNRGASETLSDSLYSVAITKPFIVPLSDNSQAILTGIAEGDKFHTYSGLDRVAAGVGAELQYRSSGEFFAPTLGLFARARLEAYDSAQRDGARYSYGVNYRQSLTDRIGLYGTLNGHTRAADGDVFDTTDYGVRLNLDYSLGRDGSLYAAGEYRRGEFTSSGPRSASSAASAKAISVEDAFPGRNYFAYRYKGEAAIWTLGYNWPLGPRDSLDFSWRYIRSEPTENGNAASGPPYYGAPGAGGTLERYSVNQLSVFYLMRF